TRASVTATSTWKNWRPRKPTLNNNNQTGRGVACKHCRHARPRGAPSMIQPVAERTPAGTSYLSLGQGQPVVLIHGVGLNKEMWGGQFVGLAGDYRVIAYDMLGHGQSPRPAADTDLQGYAAQLAELLDHLQIPQATVIGFSMGGLVARAFALHHPQRLAALVVLNSVFNRSPEQSAGVIARAAQAAEHGPDANAEAALARWFSREY